MGAAKVGRKARPTGFGPRAATNWPGSGHESAPPPAHCKRSRVAGALDAGLNARTLGYLAHRFCFHHPPFFHMSRSTLSKSSLIGLLCLAACKKDTPPAENLPIVYTSVSTLAGNGTSGYTDGSGAAAQFYGPEGVAVDAQGTLYIADAGNSCIRKVTPAGVVSTLAGSPSSGLVNGPLATARFDVPSDVALDAQGNLYVADNGNNCIRKITLAGMVSTLAGNGTAGFVDGNAATARLSYPNGLAVDAQGVVYFTEYGNHSVRKVLPNGTVSTLAGTGRLGYADGPGSTAQLNSPEGLAIDAQGTVYVAEFGGHRIRKITPDGTVSTLAGTGTRGFADGPGSTAQFYAPCAVAIDAHGDLLVADVGNYCVRKVTPAGVVTTITGMRTAGFADGPVATAKFEALAGLAVGARGVAYVTEYGERIRKITAE